MFVIQILTRKGTPHEAWCDLHPIGGTRYEFDTEHDAEHILRICYPLSSAHGFCRIVEIKEE